MLVEALLVLLQVRSFKDLIVEATAVAVQMTRKDAT
jgi:hypothetical protein